MKVMAIGYVKMVKARKNWICSKCRKEIRIGDQHFVMKYNYHPTIRRCISCKFEAWENTSSDYMKRIGKLKEQVNLLTITDQVYVDTLIEDLEALYDELEDKLWNLPDNLINSLLGNKIEDRKESVKAAIEMLNEKSEMDDSLRVKIAVNQIVEK